MKIQEIATRLERVDHVDSALVAELKTLLEGASYETWKLTRATFVETYAAARTLRRSVGKKDAASAAAKAWTRAVHATGLEKPAADSTDAILKRLQVEKAVEAFSDMTSSALAERADEVTRLGGNAAKIRRALDARRKEIEAGSREPADDLERSWANEAQEKERERAMEGARREALKRFLEEVREWAKDKPIIELETALCRLKGEAVTASPNKVKRTRKRAA